MLVWQDPDASSPPPPNFSKVTHRGLARSQDPPSDALPPPVKWPVSRVRIYLYLAFLLQITQTCPTHFPFPIIPPITTGTLPCEGDRAEGGGLGHREILSAFPG